MNGMASRPKKLEDDLDDQRGGQGELMVIKNNLILPACGTTRGAKYQQPFLSYTICPDRGHSGHSCCECQKFEVQRLILPQFLILSLILPSQFKSELDSLPWSAAPSAPRLSPGLGPYALRFYPRGVRVSKQDAGCWSGEDRA